MTQSIDSSKRGSSRAPGKERISPRIGPLLGAPPPITFRTPQRPSPAEDAPGVTYRILATAPGDAQGTLELCAETGTRIPALSILCCVTGVSLADIAPMVLDEPLEVHFQLPDVPGNIRLEVRDPADISVSIQHPPARMRSFGVERTRARRPITVPKLPAFAGFRRFT